MGTTWESSPNTETTAAAELKQLPNLIMSQLQGTRGALIWLLYIHSLITECVFQSKHTSFERRGKLEMAAENAFWLFFFFQIRENNNWTPKDTRSSDGKKW